MNFVSKIIIVEFVKSLFLGKNWNFNTVCIVFNYVSLAMRHQQIEKVHQEDRIRFRARTGFDPDQQKNHSFSGSQLMIKPTLEFAYLAKASSGYSLAWHGAAGGWRTEFFSDSEFSGWGRHHNSAFRNPKLKL